MATSPVLGKRKRDDDTLSGTMIEARVVLENHWATEPAQFPASAATTIEKLFQEVQGVLPVAKRHTLAAQKLAAPLFLLQENSAKLAALRKKKYFTVGWNSALSYKNWYQRNVLPETASILKCEVHLRTFACAVREARLEMEGGERLWFDSRYVLFEASLKPEGGHKWEISPVDADEYDYEAVDSIEDAPSTQEWFPERISSKGEEVKKDAAAAKEPKKASEEAATPVKEKSSKEGGEGGEKVKEVDEEEDFEWEWNSPTASEDERFKREHPKLWKELEDGSFFNE